MAMHVLSICCFLFFIYVPKVSSLNWPKHSANYIIGGIVWHDFRKLSYIVQIGKYRGPFFYVQHYCGGTILTTRHVLTASHCLYGMNYHTKRIRSGTRWKDYGGYVTEMAGWWRHIGPKGPYDGHDIAVIITKTEIPMINVVPTRLALVEPPDDVIVESAGWGTDEWLVEERSSSLKIVAHNMTSGEPCRGIFKWYEDSAYICTTSNTRTGAYYGDSGGPLIFNTTQVGVVSTIPIEVKRGREYIQIFTRVVHFREFIDNCTARLSMEDP